MASKRKPKWKVGDKVVLPEVKGMKYAGHEMLQDPKNVGMKGKIIAIVYVGSIPCPRIRLETGRIIHGYECWWKPLRGKP
jgi:hypothetical protein